MVAVLAMLEPLAAPNITPAAVPITASLPGTRPNQTSSDVMDRCAQSRLREDGAHQNEERHGDKDKTGDAIVCPLGHCLQGRDSSVKEQNDGRCVQDPQTKGNGQSCLLRE